MLALPALILSTVIQQRPASHHQPGRHKNFKETANLLTAESLRRLPNAKHRNRNNQSGRRHHRPALSPDETGQLWTRPKNILSSYTSTEVLTRNASPEDGKAARGWDTYMAGKGYIMFTSITVAAATVDWHLKNATFRRLASKKVKTR